MSPNYSTHASSSRGKLTLVYLKHHCMESASFFIFSTDNNGSSKSSLLISSWVDCGIDWKGTSRTVGFFDPSALSLPHPAMFGVPSPAVEGVDAGTSRGGSFDVPGMSTLVERVVEFLINPITGESGVDRVLASGLLSIQLWKSWIWFFSCAGRYWILAKQDFKKENGGKQDTIKNIIFLLASIKTRYLPL